MSTETNKSSVGSVILAAIFIAALFAASMYIMNQNLPKPEKQPGYETVWCSPTTNSCHSVIVTKYIGPYKATKYLVNKNEPSKWIEGQMYDPPVRLVVGQDGYPYSDDTLITEE